MLWYLYTYFKKINNICNKLIFAKENIYFRDRKHFIFVEENLFIFAKISRNKLITRYNFAKISFRALRKYKSFHKNQQNYRETKTVFPRVK